MQIEQLLQQYRGDVRRLFRKYTVIGDVNMDTVKKGFEIHGEKFMLDLLAIITPDDSSFSNFFTDQMVSTYNTINAPKVNPEVLEQAVTERGKFWGFWDNLFTTVGNAGRTIGQLKLDATGMNAQGYNQALQNNYAYQSQTANNRNLIIGGAAALVVILIIVFIFSKN